MPQIDLTTEPQMPWLTAESGEQAAVISSHVRLARNFRHFPFPIRADLQELAEVTKAALAIVPDLEEKLGESLTCLWIEQLSPSEREVLIDEGLVTDGLCENPQHRLALIGQSRRVGLLVNEDEHLRIQAAGAGLDLDTPFKTVNLIDDLVEDKIDVAFDAKLGYLTSCPTDLGTGLRASVILHLPGLAFIQGIDNIVNMAQQLGLSMRAMFVGRKENQQYGNLFRVSNRLTLGLAEGEILANLKSAVQEIVSHEMQARQALRDYRGNQAEDMVWRAFGILRYARLLSESEALELFSKVRLGIDMGLIAGVKADFFGEALLACQESFLKQKAGRDKMSAGELEKWRGRVARQLLHRYIATKGETK